MVLYVKQCFVDWLLDIIDLKKLENGISSKLKKIYLSFISIDGVVVIEIFKCSFITELERPPHILN